MISGIPGRAYVYLYLPSWLFFVDGSEIGELALDLGGPGRIQDGAQCLESERLAH